jgi:asparagine synthase (glutamine-hydrolysing)
MEVIGSVGMVNARLAIVDLTEAGHQPMGDPDGRWLLTYNGEIYNHAALRDELPPFPYRGHSDTETLLRALCVLGPGAVERCNGPFALAALDRRGRRLVLARDRFGVKPLYLARNHDTLWFSSEIKALLAAGVPARVRPDVLSHAVGTGLPIGRATPIEAIERVLPGTTVVVDIDTLARTETRWFEPADAVDPDLAHELAGLERSELGARVDRLLRAAVERRLMSDAPVGTMCSGGVDSSLITALAHTERPSIVAFTTSLPDAPRADESGWAERAARHLGVRFEAASISAGDWRRELVAAVHHHEYPLSGGSSVPIGVIARLAREHGVKVLLTGEGADELFGGYSHLHREEHRAFLSTPLRLSRAVERARESGPRRAAASLAERLRPRRPAEPLALERSQEVVRHREAILDAARAAYAHQPHARGRLEGALLGTLSSAGFAFLLNRMDKDAMASSVETRLPFLDPDLVALAVNLPLELRAGPRTKDILRDVARRHLPRRTADRPKHPGLVVDARRWIEEAARPAFLGRGSLREVLEVPAAEWDDLAAGAPRTTALRLWTGEIWCRLMLEGRPAEQVEEALWDPARI